MPVTSVQFSSVTKFIFRASLIAEIMTAALTGSSCISTLFSVFSRLEKFCPSVTDVVFISGGRLFHRSSDWEASWTEASSSGPRHNHTLTCRAQMATCRDRNRSDHWHEVRSGELMKTLYIIVGIPSKYMAWESWNGRATKLLTG